MMSYLASRAIRSLWYRVYSLPWLYPLSGSFFWDSKASHPLPEKSRCRATTPGHLVCLKLSNICKNSRNLQYFFSWFRLMKNLLPRVLLIFSNLIWFHYPCEVSIYFSESPKSTRLTWEFSFIEMIEEPFVPGVGNTWKRSDQSQYESKTTLLGFTSEWRYPTSWSYLRLSIYNNE